MDCFSLHVYVYVPLHVRVSLLLPFVSQEIMDADGKFVLEWEVDETNTFIEVC